MKITLNGQTKELSETLNLGQIVEQFCKDKNPVIAELNGEIINTLRWEETDVKENDYIELVGFVGGG